MVTPAFRFEDILREQGFRVTEGRLALLRELASATHPLSPSTLVQKIGTTANQATIYRSLEAFTTRGIVQRVNMEHAHAHYELSVGRGHHHHIICKQCGATEHIDGCTIPAESPPLLKQSKMFRKVDGHALEFFGTCDTCARSHHTRHSKKILR